MGTDQLLNWLDSVERAMLKATADAGFYAPGPFKELVEKPHGIISLGAKMGEGWLLTAEMIELCLLYTSRKRHPGRGAHPAGRNDVSH